MTASAVQHAVDAASREERGRVVATLIRRTGDRDLAGERAQEAFTGSAAALAKIEQNCCCYSPPLGTPKTTQDGLRRGAFPVIRGDRRR